jgi:hypothetical protein
MNDYIDLCLNEGMKGPDEYYEVIETTETGWTVYVSDCDPETCVHEAGHAVADYVLGRPIESVRSLPEDEFDDCSGKVTLSEEPEPTNDAEWLANYWRRMVTHMAGGYAQHLYSGVEPTDGMGFGDREVVYGNLISMYMNIVGYQQPPFEIPDEPGEPWDERTMEWFYEQDAALERKLWAEVERILKENWDLVESLAAVLTANPFLEGAEVYEVFERIEARRAAAA